MNGPYGLDPAHASLSAKQARALGLLTTDICGPLSSGSYDSADLSQYLANRLQAKTASHGSTLFNLIWKDRVTPAGRLIPALRASARRISVSVFTSSLQPGSKAKLRMELAGWQTPVTKNIADGTDWDTQMQALTERRARVKEAVKAGLTKAGSGRSPTLQMQAQSTALRSADLAPARLTASGRMLTGLDAGMESGGRLNPALARWLMSLPPVWCDCMVMATQLIQSRRGASSKP